MSISTKRGDDGQTDLMFGRRVSKSDQRVAAYGAADELNAALGLVRVSDCEEMTRTLVPSIQEDLIILMGELATDPEDHPRYLDSGFKLVSTEMTDRLGAEVDRIERDFEIKFKGWALPGEAGLLGAAHLDVARTVCRRAEREAAILTGGDDEVGRYLNRLSDLLWLLARLESMRSE